MTKLFAPGCALMLYKPDLAKHVHAWLNQALGRMDVLLTCCHNNPQFATPSQTINICPGCDKRFRLDYPNSFTVSLWEILADSDSFPFPDYHGQPMAILDACPARDQERIHHAIRVLLQRMNISVIEPRHTRATSVCCGDSLWGKAPLAQMKKQMRRRAADMPAHDVVVYCVSCIKSIHIGGKRPRYLVDLLFGEETFPQPDEPHAWHGELDAYMQVHQAPHVVPAL
jgi:Fe-S oxidoreductase